MMIMIIIMMIMMIIMMIMMIMMMIIMLMMIIIIMKVITMKMMKMMMRTMMMMMMMMMMMIMIPIDKGVTFNKLLSVILLLLVHIWGIWIRSWYSPYIYNNNNVIIIIKLIDTNHLIYRPSILYNGLYYYHQCSIEIQYMMMMMLIMTDSDYKQIMVDCMMMLMKL